MNYYQKVIKNILDCSDDQVYQVEDILRNVIHNGTLDHLSKDEFDSDVKFAYKILQEINKNEH